MRDTTGVLAAWLAQGGQRVGQVIISRHDDGWDLCHEDDLRSGHLEAFAEAADARLLANFDDAGAYRPLKTAPTLRHGWRLRLEDAASVRRALDYFYPAMLGVWLADADAELTPVHFRDTLGRQTGMYRVTQKLSDEQAQEVIARTCCPAACTKTILWKVDAQQPITSLPKEKFAVVDAAMNLPLFCQEACNLLVAAARKAVKGEAE